jgi:4-amino-4-deoxy-L-arabinose transferase-like glycosyltransferase
MKLLYLQKIPFVHLIYALVLCLAIALRIPHLSTIPAGLHQDEAWFAYNAFLLKESGRNIHNETWPLTVDMWGEHVSAAHSYVIVPFISLLGMGTASYRIGFVLASLLTLVLLMWALRKLFQSSLLAILFGFFYALSPWSIIMSRSSSTVVVDTLLVVLVLIFALFADHSQSEKATWWSALMAKLGGNRWQKNADGSVIIWFLVRFVPLYALSTIAYFTYFNSRVVLPAMLLLLTIWSAAIWKAAPRVTAVFVTTLCVYLIFPFFTYLQTPYALGRYEETTILNGPEVTNALFHNQAQSGQAGTSVLVTRALYNKLTMNAQVLLEQFTAFVSPSVVLFNTAPPSRYDVPNIGVVTMAEYLGLLIAVGFLFFGYTKKNTRLWQTHLLFLLLLGVSLAPTVLTIDDFPNFQRGAMAAPFWQLVVATGLTGWIWHVREHHRWAHSRGLMLVVAVGIGVATSWHVLWFSQAYFNLSPYANAHNRSRAGEVLAEWLVRERPSASWIMDHSEANFLYFYLYSKINILDLETESSGKYFLTSDYFRIGEHQYYRELCAQRNPRTIPREEHPDLFIIDTFPNPQDNCDLPPNFNLVFEASYDDGSVGYRVYERDPKYNWNGVDPSDY